MRSSVETAKPESKDYRSTWWAVLLDSKVIVALIGAIGGALIGSGGWQFVASVRRQPSQDEITALNIRELNITYREFVDLVSTDGRQLFLYASADNRVTILQESNFKGKQHVAIHNYKSRPVCDDYVTNILEPLRNSPLRRQPILVWTTDLDPDSELREVYEDQDPPIAGVMLYRLWANDEDGGIYYAAATFTGAPPSPRRFRDGVLPLAALLEDSLN